VETLFFQSNSSPISVAILVRVSTTKQETAQQVKRSDIASWAVQSEAQRHYTPIEGRSVCAQCCQNHRQGVSTVQRVRRLFGLPSDKL